MAVEASRGEIITGKVGYGLAVKVGAGLVRCGRAVEAWVGVEGWGGIRQSRRVKTRKVRVRKGFVWQSRRDMQWKGVVCPGSVWQSGIGVSRLGRMRTVLVGIRSQG